MDSHLALRRAQITDVDRILHIHRKAYIAGNVSRERGITERNLSDHVHGDQFTRQMLNHYAKHLPRAESSFLVGIMDGQIVGFCIAHATEYTFVEALYIDPEYHGFGVGGDLLSTVERAQGRRKIALRAVRHAPARNFYRRRGYQDVPGSTDRVVVLKSGQRMLIAEMHKFL